MTSGTGTLRHPHDSSRAEAFFGIPDLGIPDVQTLNLGESWPAWWSHRKWNTKSNKGIRNDLAHETTLVIA